MKAVVVGDRVRIHGRTVGAAERLGVVIDVREEAYSGGGSLRRNGPR